MTMKTMKQSFKSIKFGLCAAAVILIAFVLSPQMRFSSAVSSEGAKAETRFKTDAIRYEGAMRAIDGITAKNTDSAFDVNKAATIPDKNDTPETMMALGKEGLAVTRDATAALTDLAALSNRLSTDKAYATKLLEAVKKNDKAAVASVLKETMTRTKFTVRDIQPDFLFAAEFEVFGHNFEACVCSTQKCDGHYVYFTMD